MAFDLQGYYNEYKNNYGDIPLEDVAKDAYKRGIHGGEPDYETFKKAQGIDKVINEDNEKRRPKNFGDNLATKLTETVKALSPSGTEDYTASVLSGATMGYTKAPEVTKDTTTTQKIGREGAALTGMAVPLMGIEAALKAATGGAFAGVEAAVGGAYGALRKPEEGEDRVTNALKDAAIFGLFGVGGKILGKGLSKIPRIAAIAEKEAAGEGLSLADKAIKASAEYGKSATLMGGAGFAQPAETWEDKFRNALIGAGSGVVAHGATSGFKAGKDAIKGDKGALDKAELKRLELGAEVAAKIAEGLKNNKLDDKEFTQDDALKVIKDAKDAKIFGHEDLDNFAKKYPDLKTGIDSLKNEDHAAFSMDTINNWLTKGVDDNGDKYTPEDAVKSIRRLESEGIFKEEHINTLKETHPTLGVAIDVTNGIMQEAGLKTDIKEQTAIKKAVDTAQDKEPINTQITPIKMKELTPEESKKSDIKLQEEQNKNINAIIPEEKSKEITAQSASDAILKQDLTEPQKNSVWASMSPEVLKEHADNKEAGVITEITRRQEEEHIKSMGEDQESKTAPSSQKGEPKVAPQDTSKYSEFMPKEETKTAAEIKTEERSAKREITQEKLSVLNNERDAILARLNKGRGGDSTLNMGGQPDVELWKDYLSLGRIQIEKGYIVFKDFAENMVADLGEGIRQHLQKIWVELQTHPIFKEVEEEMRVTAEKKAAEEKVAATKASRPGVKVAKQ